MGKRLVLLLLLLISGNAQAHQLKVFAYAEGKQVQGTVYFSKGAKAAGASLQVLDSAGRTLYRLESDEAGEFAFTANSPVEHRIVADTGDGHRAEWTVSAAELGATSLPPSTAVATATRPPPAASGAAEDQRLAALMEQAVARQVGPLRQELQTYADRLRLSDLLGGVGFIFGLAGLALWWHGRRQGPGA